MQNIQIETIYYSLYSMYDIVYSHCRIIVSEGIMPIKKHINKNELKVLSLFSGCGGLDLGFEGGFVLIYII